MSSIGRMMKAVLKSGTAKGCRHDRLRFHTKGTERNLRNGGYQSETVYSAVCLDCGNPTVSFNLGPVASGAESGLRDDVMAAKGYAKDAEDSNVWTRKAEA